MKKRLFIYGMSIILVALLAFLGVSVYVTNRNNLTMSRNKIMQTVKISAALFAEDISMGTFAGYDGDIRITIISSDGVVLADSDPAELQNDNYLTRPEVASALKGTPEMYMRYSTTHHVDFIYYAQKVPTNDGFVFIRAAMPVARINEYLWQSLSSLVVMLVVLAFICFFVISTFANRILESFGFIENNLRLLLSGNYKQQTVVSSFDEINKIAREIDSISILLQENYKKLSDEKDKLSYILDSIGNGLFVMDGELNLALVNVSACNIFSASPDIAGKNLKELVRDKKLYLMIADFAENSQDTLFEFTLDSKNYLVTLKRLPNTDLTIAAFADITEVRESAKRREEFFENASHELKTPLTAIRGFVELAENENKEERLAKFLNGISRETARMTVLIGDMLKLSEIENTTIKNPVPNDLATIVNEIKDAFLHTLNEKRIFFKLNGNASIVSEPKHIYGIIKNLIENAIRYNTVGGSVLVKIETRKNNVTLSVTDTGIGISPNEQAKIFERFYRVEKSRSVEGGGTGLGLAIIKHTCALYNWKLSLSSRLGSGTTVTVEFF